MLKGWFTPAASFVVLSTAGHLTVMEGQRYTVTRREAGQSDPDACPSSFCMVPQMEVCTDVTFSKPTSIPGSKYPWYPKDCWELAVSEDCL